MFNFMVIAHIVPLDGKLFDDPEQAITSLIILNTIVLALIIIAIKAMREQRKAEARALRAQKKTASAFAAQDMPVASLTTNVRPASPRPGQSAGSRNRRKKKK